MAVGEGLCAKIVSRVTGLGRIEKFHHYFLKDARFRVTTAVVFINIIFSCLQSVLIGSIEHFQNDGSSQKDLSCVMLIVTRFM